MTNVTCPDPFATAVCNAHGRKWPCGECGAGEASATAARSVAVMCPKHGTFLGGKCAVCEPAYRLSEIVGTALPTTPGQISDALAGLVLMRGTIKPAEQFPRRFGPEIPRSALR